MTRLLAFYPRAWRDRYEMEFRALMAERPPSPRDGLDIVRGAIDARLHPQVGVGRPVEEADPSTTGRLGSLLSVVGGALWVASGLAFHNAWYNPGLGYKDSGSAIVIAIAAALVTGIAAVTVTRSLSGRNVLMSIAAAAIVLGGIAMTQPWPVLFLGYFAAIIGTLVFGLIATPRLGLTGIVLAVGAMLAFGFNTEDERALLLVGFGAAWMLFGIVLAFRGIPSRIASEPLATAVTPPRTTA